MRIYFDGLSRIPTVSIGSQALIIGSMQIIKDFLGDVEFVLLSSHPELENAYLSKEPYKFKLIRRRESQLGTIKDIRNIMKEVDLVVSALGDGFVASTTSPSRLFLKTAFFKRPAILFPSSIGPFPHGLKMFLAKRGLKKYDFIMARDSITFESLKKIGFKNTDLVPDSAFILEPANKERINEICKRENISLNKQYIGLNISQLLNCWYKEKLGVNYPELMAELVSYLNQNFNSNILLIPHQIYPGFFKCDNSALTSANGDDRVAIKEMVKYLPDKEIFTPILDEYSAREYKGLIGKCEIFIGGRMHSVIGALSMGVPTIIIQYSHKAPGMMETLGLSSYVWDYKSSIDVLKSLVGELWAERQTIRSKIKNVMTDYKKDALRAGEILVNIIKQYKLR